jgi:sterol desaturase/sphingolipid hydroxylase (fatty acid hydroxylase superfamily)
MDISSELVAVNTILITLMLSEGLYTKFALKKQAPWKEMIYNLNSGHLIMWIFRTFEIIGYYYIWSHSPFRLFEGVPYWTTVIIAFVCWDFGFYWFHRMHHKFSILWALHNVHHEGEHFNLSLGIRNAWFSSISALPFYSFMAIAGINVEIFVMVASTHIVIQFYNHNGIVKKSGFLEHIMITPSHHRVHHGMQELYIDKNFGGTLLLWDKMFGTFQREEEHTPVEFGTAKPLGTTNVFWGNLIPIFRWLGFDVKAPVQGKYRISNLHIVIHGMLLFTVYIQYLLMELNGSYSDRIIVFCIGIAGTIGLGFISDQKLWGYRFNMLASSLLVATYFTFFRISDPWFEGVLALLIVSNTMMLLTAIEVSTSEKSQSLTATVNS